MHCFLGDLKETNGTEALNQLNQACDGIRGSLKKSLGAVRDSFLDALKQLLKTLPEARLLPEELSKLVRFFRAAECYFRIRRWGRRWKAS